MKKGMLIAFIGLILYFIFKDRVNASVVTVVTGVPRGFRNNNPGNIKKSPETFLGETTTTDNRFKMFLDMKSGLRAMMKILDTYFEKGFDTNYKIAQRWSNESGHKLINYIKVLEKYNGKEPDETIYLDGSELMNLVKGIVYAENGKFPNGFENIGNDNSLLDAYSYYIETR